MNVYFSFFLSFFSGKTVAIKRYNVDRHLTETGEDLSPYIQHEVAAMKMLRHSNILPCLASFVVGEQVGLSLSLYLCNFLLSLFLSLERRSYQP